MSKYDNIETAADLISEVVAHGLSTETEDHCRAQDIFGNSPVGELTRLANDNGRNNENGEPDPDGSWSSGRKGTQETFYFILFSIWNWRDATAFYNERTNPVIKEAKKASGEVKELRSSLEATTHDRDAYMERCDAATERAKEYAYKIDDLAAEIQQKEAEITGLKARLYDLICSGK